jgi:hypothetical protein
MVVRISKRNAIQNLNYFQLIKQFETKYLVKSERQLRAVILIGYLNNFLRDHDNPYFGTR